MAVTAVVQIERDLMRNGCTTTVAGAVKNFPMQKLALQDQPVEADDGVGGPAHEEGRDHDSHHLGHAPVAALGALADAAAAAAAGVVVGVAAAGDDAALVQGGLKYKDEMCNLVSKHFQSILL